MIPPVITNRVEVALISEAAHARDRLTARTDLNRADVNNRALQLYDAIDAEVHAGAELLLVYPSGRVAALRFTVDPEQLDRDQSGVAIAERVTAPFTSWAVEALDRISARRGFSKIDVLNQALQVYDRVDEERRLGAAVVFRYPDGRTAKLRYQ